jgi:hypothetical protein
MSTLDLPIPLAPGAPATRSMGTASIVGSCDRFGEIEGGDTLMRAYVRANLAQVCLELQSWDRFREPKPQSFIGHAAALLSGSWGETFNAAAAAHVVETFARDECVARLAAPDVLARRSFAAWRSRLFQVNVWLQLIGAGMGLLGQFYINERNAAGFVCWIISNCALLILQRRTKLRVLVALHSIYLLMSFQGLYLWLAH